MDTTALFTITYGVYTLSTKCKDKVNACIINTVTQVTQEPLRLSATVLKSNYTHDLIVESRQFNVSVLGEQATLDMIARFGFQSGRTVDKFEGFSYTEDLLGNPVIEEGCIANFTCKVTETVDLGTHTLFIADVVDTRHLNPGTAMTYSYYRDLKMGKIKPQEDNKVEVEEVKEVDGPTYQCSVCHYIYDGDIPFEELGDDYLCPLCNQPKSAFVKKED